MTTRDWAVDAAEDAMTYMESPFTGTDTERMHAIADRIRSHAQHSGGGEVEPYERDGYPTNDRDMLQYLMRAFDVETWQCDRCGHSEDTKTMDSAYALRDYLLAHPRPVVPDEDDSLTIAYMMGRAERGVVPEGYVLAPVEATDEMAKAVFPHSWEIAFRDAFRREYRAAIASLATPTTNAGRG